MAGWLAPETWLARGDAPGYAQSIGERFGLSV
jgi:hypothetical protein